MKLLAELDNKKGIGLIERVRQGLGRPSKIYVKRFTTRKAPPKPTSLPPEPFAPISEVDFSDVQKSENPTSKGRKNPRQEVEEIDPSYTKRIQTDFIQPYPSISPRQPPEGPMGMDRYEQREIIKENIGYEQLQREIPFDDVESLIVDVICSTAATMRIGGEVLPAETVKRRFQQLDGEHIRYVVESMRQTTTKINNIRAYLLTALYNAPVTIGPYYTAAVRHDFG